MARQLHLGAFMRPVSIHTAWWRYPGSLPDANFNFKHLARFAQTLERGRFDAFFMADHLALLNMSMDALKRSATVTSFDPLTLLPALAVVTEHIGLIATASTTYNDPYHIARKFASLDHISNGRAGWNLVTTSNPDAALNFGHDEHAEHGERYRRGREFFDVVTGLWDSWADDAFIRDVESGVFFDPERLHVLGHKGEYLSVRGPLNIARPVQGWPVIVQAGASEAGRQIAAETAEVIFASASTLADGQRFYADVKGRLAPLGRSRDHLKILPGVLAIVGDTVEEARAKRRTLDSLVHSDSAIANLSMRLGTDASGFDPDGPLPEIPETNASKTARQSLIDMARRENLTVRQLAQRVGGYAGLAMVGTAATIADEMEAWLLGDACDGFNVMFPFLPAGLDDFVDKVVPELQRRGLFRREYEGRTLRENLGLPRPPNRFFDPAGDTL
jgi:FMN-dependent oxidoreductase (nitrilotriacetate monooxygenase family)